MYGMYGRCMYVCMYVWMDDVCMVCMVCMDDVCMYGMYG